MKHFIKLTLLGIASSSGLYVTASRMVPMEPMPVGNSRILSPDTSPNNKERMRLEREIYNTERSRQQAAEAEERKRLAQEATLRLKHEAQRIESEARMAEILDEDQTVPQTDSQELEIASHKAPRASYTLWNIFDIIQDELEKAKNANPETMVRARNTIDEFIKTELAKDATALEKLDPLGLTPAHSLVLKLFMLNRAMHHWGYERWKGQEAAYHQLFIPVFEKLKTERAVQVKDIKKRFEVEGIYLEHAGITKKPMTAFEMYHAFFPAH